MRKSQRDTLDKVVKELDTAVGMLIVASGKDITVKKAMEKVSDCSFDICNILALD